MRLSNLNHKRYSILILNANAFVQLFGGFLIALSSLPEWIHWIKYLSLFRYALEVQLVLKLTPIIDLTLYYTCTGILQAMSINEINGKYYCPNGTFTEQPV
jgi:hypothetical protein